ncbi:hypothetical protein HMPREF9372_3391 [Sporosarcina newyorkensis 2681]|uniref:Uncharacterized protein n=1 Tax=Sporosarcina newyorkensis 2681 TaxID=1027292 RepID=F9DX60_9BACL|nr:hypothetical protein [Sporosarcina newyorkensis]EGQ21108.1 hypothetical protein HMPREF9372_3391 [Sporosarcina newyorkensis 2681]
MKLTNEMVYHYATEWHAHGRDLFELDDGDVLILNNGLEVKLTNDSHPEFIQGIARMLGDEEVAGVLIYGNRDAYIHFLKQGEF